MHLIPLDSASLQEAIATQSQGHLVVIMFSASWCQPCNRAKPLVNVMASCLSDVSFGVLVSDESPANEACAMSFDVNTFPTIILFLDGQEVWRQRGFNQLELINRIQQLRPQLDDCVAALLENEPGLARSTANILLRIADNILSHPLEEKYRRLKVSSNTVSEKLLPVSGGIECLFAMGFTDDAGANNNGEFFELAPGPLVRVAKIRNQLVRVVTDSRHLPSIYVNMIPALASPRATNHQLVFSLMSHLSGMPKYEDPGLQSRARECIPLKRLEEAARARVRQQLALSSSEVGSQGQLLTEVQVPAAERDSLLCELTAWFKNEFFKWTNSPKCSVCGQECQSSNNANLPPNEEERRYGAIRVESHYCHRCQRVERFPRYNHPEKLLQTRNGRCGEWANCFYLLCRALSFDTRFVYDVTDHVWVEVFSELEQRWLHVDPCENLIDVPLVYENGWKKSLTFVFAMSHEELVDVSWRYSSKHKQLLARRAVNEIWLGQVVDCLERTLQDDYLHMGAERKRLLRLRRVHEIVEFLTPRQASAHANSAESQGRQSGSLVWRLSRGEATNTDLAPSGEFKFKPTESEASASKIYVTYDPVVDSYRRGAGGDPIRGWRTCLNRCSQLALKRESDWRMVYLSRPEGCPAATDGEASWLVDLAGTEFSVGRISISAEATIFDESAGVRWEVHLDGNRVTGSSSGRFSFEAAGDGAKSVRVTARLTGGQGSLAWQKCQLFRRSLDGSDSSPFELLVELKPNSATAKPTDQSAQSAKASEASAASTNAADSPSALSLSSVTADCLPQAVSSQRNEQKSLESGVDGRGDSGSGYIIIPTERELASGHLALTYDIFSDKYTRSSDGHSASIGWRGCACAVSNLRRVVEDNPGCPGRKVAYLCRESGGPGITGSIEWRVDLSALGGAYRLANLRLMLSLAANHSGVVAETCLSSDTGACVTVQESFYSGQVANGARWLSVKAQIRQLPMEAGVEPTWGQLFRVADSNCPLLPLSMALDIVKL